MGRYHLANLEVPNDQTHTGHPNTLGPVSPASSIGPLGLCENGPQNFMVNHYLLGGLEHEWIMTFQNVLGIDRKSVV
mgnify:CR=1 FL=1